ncbi:hypothetical protein ABKV19_004120 [Rosa sericea]
MLRGNTELRAPFLHLHPPPLPRPSYQHLGLAGALQGRSPLTSPQAQSRRLLLRCRFSRRNIEARLAFQAPDQSPRRLCLPHLLRSGLQRFGPVARALL